MTAHLVTREEWLKARRSLLECEKALTRERDALSAARRSLPLVAVTEDYCFETNEGEQSLAELFAGRSQLIVYHFMYGPGWEAGCPSCSFWCDNFHGIDVHLAARDTRLVLVSRAPLATLLAYRDRMGWDVSWVSCLGSRFGEDFGVSFPTQEALESMDYNYGKRPYAIENPGISVFYRLPSGQIAHSYSTYGRGLDMMNTAYHLLDLTPKGRDEDGLAHTMAWLRRRDEYGS